MKKDSRGFHWRFRNRRPRPITINQMPIEL
jgi:hypothetical protein